MSDQPSALHRFYSRWLTQPTDDKNVQFLRYGLVAGIAFVFDFGGLYIFTSVFHWHYLLSTTLSFAISVAVNYALSTLWVFTSRIERQRSHELFLFIAICAVALGLNDLFMWLFTSVMSIFYLYSKLLTVTIVFFWSFGARRFIFNRRLTDIVKRSPPNL
jgi:putative flippase GtrA